MSTPLGAHAAARSYRRDPEASRHQLSPGTWRRVVGYARPYRWPITAFLALTVVSAGLVVVGPILLGRLVDDGVTPGNRDVVVGLAALAVVVALAELVVTLVERRLSAGIGEGLIYDLRTEVYDHVQRQPVAFFTLTQTGSLVTRLNSDVIGAQRAFTTVLSGVVSNVVSVAAVLTTMAVLSWQVTLASLVLVPVFLVPARWIGRRLQALTRESFELNAELGTRMTERFNVGGALLVRLLGRPRVESTEYAERAGRVRDIGVRIALVNRFFVAALTLVAALATALTYGIGGLLAIEGALTVGTLLALTALLARLYGPLTGLSNVRVDIMTALVSFERVFEVLDLEPLVTESPEARDLPSGPLDVRLDGVGFGYPAADEVAVASLRAAGDAARRGGGVPVLHDVSFAAPPGSTVALVGPSGAGKTTITALLARLYDPTSGHVALGGIDLREATFASLRSSVGVVTQDAHLFHDTIRANLRYAAPDATDDELREALREAQALELVDSLPDGLDTVVGDRGHRLSGGEKQRLAIARLLLRDPGLVLLDEATAHLDSHSEAAVQEALRRTLAGRTAVVVAHRLSTVRDADLVLVVDGGRVVERGSHAELLALDGLYARLHRTQLLADADQPGAADDARSREPAAPAGAASAPGDAGGGPPAGAGGAGGGDASDGAQFGATVAAPGPAGHRRGVTSSG